jgi:hypothetical protein
MTSPFEFLDCKMLNVYNWDSNGIRTWKREKRNEKYRYQQKTLFLYYLYM